MFGESDKDRRLRLRALELIEENDATKEGGGGLNEFKRALAGMEEGIDAKEIERRMFTGKDAPSSRADTPGSDPDAGGKKADKKPKIQEVLDLSLVQRDSNALYPIIYRVLKDVLAEWGEAMDQRPGTFSPICDISQPREPYTHDITICRCREAVGSRETGCCNSSHLRGQLETFIQNASATCTLSGFPFDIFSFAPLTLGTL